jgi:hypothetical protein
LCEGWEVKAAEKIFKQLPIFKTEIVKLPLDKGLAAKQTGVTTDLRLLSNFEALDSESSSE